MVNKRTFRRNILRKIKEMKKLYIFILVLLVTASWQKNDKEVYAFDFNATEYFNLGLESSMVYKKIDYFSKALELNPRFAPAYEKRGLHYYFQEKYDKVIEDFTHFKGKAFRKIIPVHGPNKLVSNLVHGHQHVGRTEKCQYRRRDVVNQMHRGCGSSVTTDIATKSPQRPPREHQRRCIS